MRTTGDNSRQNVVTAGRDRHRIRSLTKEPKMKIKLYYYFNSEAFMPEEEISISTFERSKEYSPELVFIKAIDIDVPDVIKPDREFIVCIENKEPA